MMQYSIPSGARASLDVTTTNRVLRNTYTLLAITMLPTIGGAYVGALFPIFAALGWMSFIVFFAALLGLQAMVIKNRNSAVGIGWLLVFTFVMGYFIGPMIDYALGTYSNGTEMVAMAIGGTAALFFGLAGYASVTKRNFAGISLFKTLFIGMWMLIIISVVNALLFESSAASLAISSLFIVIASGFILSTVNRIVRGGEDNYILAAMVIYIMLLNIFQSLLHLLMAFTGTRD